VFHAQIFLPPQYAEYIKMFLFDKGIKLAVDLKTTTLVEKTG